MTNSTPHDLDNIEDGIYYTSGAFCPTNAPTTSTYNNIIIQISNPRTQNSPDKIQFLYTYNSRRFFTRAIIGSGFSDWKILMEF